MKYTIHEPKHAEPCLFFDLPLEMWAVHPDGSLWFRVTDTWSVRINEIGMALYDMAPWDAPDTLLRILPQGTVITIHQTRVVD